MKTASAPRADRSAGSFGRLLRAKPVKVGAVVVTAAAATALGAGVASSGSKPRSLPAAAAGRAPAVRASTTTVTTIPTTTTTVDSAPVGTPIAVPAGGFGIGSRGPAVTAIKQRLAQLRYDPGTATDAYDYPLYYAVVAFQKVSGLPRTGRVTPAVAAAMVSAGLPTAIEPNAEANRVEIDLTRQVLFFWQNAKLVRILPVSSGFGGHYCGDDGSCGIATTPVGAFKASSKILGEHKSPLGELWDPVFFNGGIAIHGEPSVPTTPASHGCVRIPMNDASWMYDSLTLGTPVYVADSAHTPVPFNQGGTPGPGQPGGTPPTLPHPTTTATKATTTTTVKTTTTTAKPVTTTVSKTTTPTTR
jgi:peptidoglycan hydrolase-like protein with peptidoglycan-binding domain